MKLFPFKHKRRPKAHKATQDQKALEQSARILLRRNFELTQMNDRFDKQILQLKVLQESILLANQTKDVHAIFESIGRLLLKHVNYDRFFVIVKTEKSFAPVAAVGFDDAPFNERFSRLQQSDALTKLFGGQPSWLLDPSGDPLANEVLGALNVSSVALMRLSTRQHDAMLGVCMDQPIDALSLDDVDFLFLLVGQLSAVIENIDSFNLLQAQYKELRQLDKAKTIFLSIASHQLRTPLSVMKFAISFLVGQQAGTLNPKQLEMVEEMKKSNLRLINLVNNLLSVTRIQEGRIRVNPEQFNLASLIQEITKDYEEQRSKKGVTIVATIPPEISLTADKMLIREALANLVSNGIKYNKDSGHLVIQARQEAGRVIVNVMDTGIGVPKEDMNRLFSAFYRSERASVVDPEGVGLGLYVTREFIRLHHGEVVAASEPDRGTAFTIVLPNKI